MTNKQKIKLWADNRLAYGYDIDSDILNLTYRVITHYCRHIDIDDIGDIYDNLEINGHQINADTLSCYDDATIKRLSSHNLAYVEKQIKLGYFFLLDFYAYQNGYLKHFDGHFIKFKAGYNYL